LAIERLRHVELAFPLSRRDEVLAALHTAELMHVEEAPAELVEGGASRLTVTTEEMDARVAALAAAVEVIEQHCPPRRTLVESFFPAHPPASRSDLAAAGRDLDIERIGQTAGKLRERWRQVAKFEGEAQAELAALRPFAGLSFTSRDLEAVRRSRVVFGQMRPDRFNDLRLDPAAQMLAWEEVRREKARVWLLAAFHPAEAEAALARLREHAFEETAFPRLGRPVEERIAALHRDLARADEERAAIRGEAGRLAGDYAEILRALAFWEDRRELRRAAACTAAVGRAGVLTGWVRERDVPAFEAMLANRLGFAAARLRAPADGDDPPVALRLPGLLRPMRLLVDMFGLPGYRGFDPTAYLSLSFLVFFGCCFGDVVYGLGLCALSAYVMIRYRHATWVRGFFQFFLYAGLSACLFGLITGSWMGDLLTSDKGYVSPDNPLVRFARACVLLDTVAKPVPALIVALCIGVANQIYGIVIKMAMELRRGNVAAAAFDAGLWLLVLPGLILFAVGSFVPGLPPWLGRTGLWAALAGMAGLVLTQGRGEKGLVAKVIYGVVSLYGILGSYGVVSFFGDVLSYSRLLALGLATSIIGLSVNVMAGMLREVPAVGALLFVLMLVLGHAFNGLMSILGAFVHPARLILLEFFGRFYESGGRAFRPLGFRSERVEIVKSAGG
jgi:V/A-type H+-transporting ATPase subunit I